MSKTYQFTGMMTISVHLELEAESLEEAIALMHESPTMSFCHQCANGESGAWSTSGELDGEVTDIEEILVNGEPLTKAQQKRINVLMRGK